MRYRTTDPAWPGVHKLLANYQTGGYKFRRYAIRFCCAEFMNAHKQSTQV